MTPPAQLPAGTATLLFTDIEGGLPGFTVLSGRCGELADTDPYLPLADALRGAGPQADGTLQEALATRPARHPS